MKKIKGVASVPEQRRALAALRQKHREEEQAFKAKIERQFLREFSRSLNRATT